MNVEQDLTIFTSQFDNTNDYKYYDKIKGFDTFLRKGFHNMNMYKIYREMPCNSKKCLNYISSSKIREDISKGSMTCKVIKKINDKSWYEIIKINAGDSLFFDNLYSVELIQKKDNMLFSYSKDPPGSKFDESLEKRENLFTGIKCDSIDENNCLLTIILSFGEFEISQKTILKAMIDHFELFREALKI
ncbi:hypothetical protein CPAV1605_1489 [seawater metagenome]|uniref:START domain-containing protein n=1 Tax=seawater metagenome TaxID=1561972 RepID=A0A5E8CJZ7_9ZZZZ